VSEPTLVSRFALPLGRARIPYLVTGAVAAAVYGEPRLTRDIDLVLALRPADAGRFAALWPEGEFYAPPVEAIEAEARRPSGGHFNVAHHESAMRADVYLAGDDPFMRWALERGPSYQVEGAPVSFAPPEYVIVQKLRYVDMSGSERHLRDVAGIIAVSGDRLDPGALDRWIVEFHLEKTWRRAQRFVP